MIRTMFHSIIHALTSFGKTISAPAACALILAAWLWPAPAALAEDITYPDPNVSLKSDIVIDPSSPVDSLFPNLLSGNTVTVNTGASIN